MLCRKRLEKNQEVSGLSLAERLLEKFMVLDCNVNEGSSTISDKSPVYAVGRLMGPDVGFAACPDRKRE